MHRHVTIGTLGNFPLARPYGKKRTIALGENVSRNYRTGSIGIFSLIGTTGIIVVTGTDSQVSVKPRSCALYRPCEREPCETA